MSPRGSQLKKRHHGFSLTELTVSLAILGVLVFALPPLIPQVRQMLSGQQSLSAEDAGEALMGFVVAHNRLPCPDTGSDGQENCGESGVSNDIGLLPWRTMGLSGGVSPNRRKFRRVLSKCLQPLF